MAIDLNDSIRVKGGKPAEDKRLNNGFPYTSVAQVIDLIKKTDRYQSLEVVIKLDNVNQVYWWKEGVEDTDLVLSISASTPETLETVMNRGSKAPKPIIFEEYDGVPVVSVGMNDTYSLFFGNMNLTQTGYYNLSYGYGALANLTTGDSNTALGSLSMSKATTALWNTSVGYRSLEAITTGHSNTAYGHSSLYSLTNGYKNIGIGLTSGAGLKTGSYNVLIGHVAGGGIVNGYGNLIIGAQAGTRVEGNNNVFIGTGAGMSPTGNTTINNRLVINGVPSFVPSTSPTVENGIVTANNNYNTGLIIGDFLEKWVKINGNFKVPTLEMEVTTANSVPNKIWNDGVDEYYTNNAGINYKKITDRIVNVDKTGQAAYSKVMVIHPTTKETVVRDFADPSATTLAVQNASVSQKTAMRTALLGAAVPASPVINSINSGFIRKGIGKTIYLNGLNLTPLEPISIWIESGGVKVYADYFYAVTAITLQTNWTIPLDFPEGIYQVKIQNGAVVQGASNGKLIVTSNTVDTKVNLTELNSRVYVRSGYELRDNTTKIASENIFITQRQSTSYATWNDGTYDAVIKTDNIFKGALDSSWEIVIDNAVLISQGNSGAYCDHIFLSESTNDVSHNPISLIRNIILMTDNTHTMQLKPTNGSIASNQPFRVVITKGGNSINTYYVNQTTKDISWFSTIEIDPTKNYALCFMQARSAGTNVAIDMKRQFTLDVNILDA